VIRHDHLFTVHIVSTRRLKFFQSRVILTAIATSVFKDHDGNEVTKETNLVGGYNFANKRFRLFPDNVGDNSPHLVLTCDFDSGDAENADCTIDTELTQQQCAVAFLQLEEPPEEEDD
jgi:hypothetical protein